MKFAWITDIHLNFLEKKAREAFYLKMTRQPIDAVLISGDIGEGDSICRYLIEMSEFIPVPIYFVLGNHDYYHCTINDTREKVSELCEQFPRFFWLPASGGQIINQNILIAGQDGWADGRLGNYQESPVIVNDSRLIDDIIQASALGKQQLLYKLQELADHESGN